MQALPQEVISHILGFILVPTDRSRWGPDNSYGPSDWTDARVAGLASLSRPWQHAVESHTFRKLHVKSSDLGELASVLSSVVAPFRKALIQRLHVDILLPAYTRDARTAYETNDDRALNNLIAGERISHLLHILQSSTPIGDLSLVLDIYSPTDPLRRAEGLMFNDPPGDLGEDRYRYSYITLPDISYTVPCVTSFWLSHTRFLSPESMVRLTAAFPKLKSVFWEYQEPGYFIGHRRHYLQEFAHAVAHYRLPSTAETFYITINSPDYLHIDRLPNLINAPGMTPRRPESLCNELRYTIGAAHNLKWIQYRGPLDPTLFWPMDGSDSGLSEGWNSVEGMVFETTQGSFSGQWYFKGRPEDASYHVGSDVPLPPNTAGIVPPGYGSLQDTLAARALIMSNEPQEDEDGLNIGEFRSVVRDEVMNPLLDALARRLSTMPSLQRARIKASLPESKPGEWFIEYVAPGHSPQIEGYLEEPRDGSVAQVFMHTDGWRPGAEVMHLFQEIGRILHGEESTIIFLPFLWAH